MAACPPIVWQLRDEAYDGRLLDTVNIFETRELCIAYVTKYHPGAGERTDIGKQRMMWVVTGGAWGGESEHRLIAEETMIITIV